ncbi:hypothetical protein ACFV2H_25570 [Streptomyces sp. NPDC059629]|uniref:hypothetical protein n=1 Tax=Streptomyces sp. NPDC059629 TaxID=3346889 RepID=UPI00367EC32A
MNGVFDLAGTDGVGPVVVPEDEPVFRAEWEKAVFPMFAMCFRAGFFGVDSFATGPRRHFDLPLTTPELAFPGPLHSTPSDGGAAVTGFWLS